jgi:hypothetical protein
LSPITITYLLQRDPIYLAERSTSPNQQKRISQYTLTPHYQIRTSEDILTLTRQMQELWLFGQLKTLDKNDIQGRIDADAKEVAEMLAVLVSGDKEDNTMKIEG